MATLTPAKISWGTYATGATDKWGGLDISAALTSAASGGDKFKNDGRTFFRAKNGNGSIATLTFKKYRENNEGFIQDLVIDIDATTGDRVIGPFGAEFNDGSGYVNVTYSAVTSLTVKAYSLAETGY